MKLDLKAKFGFGNGKEAALPEAQSIGTLRHIINSTQHAEELSSIPEHLGYVLKHFDSIDCDPIFREDIYAILVSSNHLARAMADRTYPLENCVGQISELMRVLAGLLGHLHSARPKQKGFSVLFPTLGTMVETVHHTEGEAGAKLRALRAMGIKEEGQIIPVEVRSGVALQPQKKQKAETFNEVEQNHLSELQQSMSELGELNANRTATEAATSDNEPAKTEPAGSKLSPGARIAQTQRFSADRPNTTTSPQGGSGPVIGKAPIDTPPG